MRGVETHDYANDTHRATSRLARDRVSERGWPARAALPGAPAGAAGAAVAVDADRLRRVRLHRRDPPHARGALGDHLGLLFGRERAGAGLATADSAHPGPVCPAEHSD